MTPSGAAKLVLTIAEAVQHAHQRGVLHRDLKPANVLVDQNGKPHITDFGLARRIESDSQLTQTGAILGTPSYMAPEQTTGDKGLTTTATDVYGLGAILYTMLTGNPPFRGDSVIMTIEYVRQRAPDPPSRCNPKVRRDLEAICLKCLEKNRDDRYLSAASLAGDLRRFLNGKPVEARPVGKAVRMRRWCRRNPAIAALSATAALLLVAGLAATSVGWFSTASALDQARDARFDAELRLQDSQMAVNELLIAVNNSPEMQLSGFEHVRRQLLSRAETFLRKLTDNAPDDPRLKQQHNEIRFSLARLKSSLSDFDGARSIADKLLAELPEADSSNEQQIKRRIDLSRFLAQQYFHLNNIAKREHFVGRSLELARENFGDENASIEDQIELATTLSELASIFLKWGDNTLSADLANEAVLIWDNLDIDTDDPETRLTMGKVYLIAGKARGGAQQKAQSKLAIKMAIQILESLYEDRETVKPETLFLLAESHKGMGWLHDKDFESAKKSYERAQLIANELVLGHPLVPDYHVKRLNVDTSFGISCGINGKTEESLTLLEANANDIPELIARFPESIQALEKTLGTNYSMIGYVCNATNDFSRAHDTQQKSRLLYEKQFARNGGSPQSVLDLAMCDGNIASALIGLQRLDEAQKVINEKAIPALLELLENDPKNGTARRYMWANYGELARILQEKGQPKFALTKFQQAMKYFFSDVEQIYCREAAYLARAGKFDTAVARFTVFFEFEPEVGVYASTSQPANIERAMRASLLIKAMTETQSSQFDAQAKQQIIDQVAELGILALSTTANDPKLDDEAMVELLDNSKMEALKATAQFAKWTEIR